MTFSRLLHDRTIERSNHRTIFICGTDTNVGKTIVTAGLGLLFLKSGLKVGAYKPTESCDSALVRSCDRKDKIQRSSQSDSVFLKDRLKMPESLNLINPYYFSEPLAPGVAALRAGKKISFSKIKKNLNQLKKNYDLVLIEGAGGLLVPVDGKRTNLDLIKYLKTPVIIVARLGLGTINHTLLTYDHLIKNGVKVLGVVLNQLTPTKNVADLTNPGVLKKYIKVPIVLFPHLK